MGCARLLHCRREIDLFDLNDHVGGHSNTVTVEEGKREIAIDTGFMVFNKMTYPLLTRLFKEIDAPVKKTLMSFSVQHLPTGLEYCGSSINHLFAQRRNLVRPRFWCLLQQINRFNQEAIPALQDSQTRLQSLGDYVEDRRYGSDFLRYYLVPMSSAVWSTDSETILRFPALSLLNFFRNHGFLGLHSQHQWWTVEGGAKSYVKRLVEPFKDRICLRRGIVGVTAESDGVVLETHDGERLKFDRVILACHGDQALELLKEPEKSQREVLSKFRYQSNLATLHTDSGVMPRKKLAWSSWNYRIEEDSNGCLKSSTIYWMNSLQGVSQQQDYFVSINGVGQIQENQILKQIQYEHPLFDLDAVAAQEQLPGLNRQSPDQRIYFCGSYFRNGFHEDALVSAVDVSRVVLGDEFDSEWASI
jgi:predicted NAD/FAD-binding protein